MTKYSCDTLIVGGGTTGCVLAARLSERGDQSVILVEAGPDYGSFKEGRWPAELLDYSGNSGRTGGNKLGGSHDWDYWNEPRPNGVAYPLSCARVIGGCSSHNGSFINWGQSSDYDEWAAAGNPGWGFAEMLPCLQRVESDREAEGEWHGRQGPVPIVRHDNQPLIPFHEALAASAPAIGIPWLDDMNDPTRAVGIGRLVQNVSSGVRWNSAFAYVDAARERPNFRILDRALVTRVLLRDSRAHGVEALTPEGTVEISAGRVIISSGAYNSPAILLRSGIGPASHLEAVGVPVVHDLPGVGEHLMDHCVTPMRFLATPAAALESAALARQGRYYPHQLYLRARSSHSQAAYDLACGPPGGEAVFDGWEHLFRLELVKPQSTGVVRLRSPDPGEPPLIDSRFLSDQEGRDMAAMLDLIALIRRLVDTPPFADFIAAERWPGRAVEGQSLVEFVRTNAQTYHHPNGACKMGPASDPLAVVDTCGRVHGIEGLHVGDASIMPTIPGAPTNLTCLAIGERLAELLI